MITIKVIVTGVKGSGKTTTVQRIQDKMPDVKILIVGDYFEKAFKELHGKKAKREMTEEIDRETALNLQKKIAERLAEDSKGAKHVLIDTNLFFVRKDGFFPGLPEEFLRILNPDVIVVLEVDPNSILERRLEDEKRKGEEITEIGTIAKHRIRHAGKSIEEIETEQEIQRLFAVNCASLIGCSVKIINLRFEQKKKFEHAEVAAEEIVKLMKM